MVSTMGLSPKALGQPALSRPTLGLVAFERSGPTISAVPPQAIRVATEVILPLAIRSGARPLNSMETLLPFCRGVAELRPLSLRHRAIAPKRWLSYSGSSAKLTAGCPWAWGILLATWRSGWLSGTSRFLSEALCEDDDFASSFISCSVKYVHHVLIGRQTLNRFGVVFTCEAARESSIMKDEVKE